VLSIADLGVLRDARVQGDGTVEVDITPTYSGCPAMNMIALNVEAALAAAGIAAQVKLVLAPAWTTDWMTQRGRDRRRDCGTTMGTTMAMRPVFEDGRIPFISLAGGIEIIEPVAPFAFKTPHTDKMACEQIFADIRARGLSRVGMISGTDGFGQSTRTQCQRVAGAAGITIVADEQYGPHDSDMTPQLTRIRNTAGVEAVVNAGFGQGPAIVTRG
jgi:metal-sulfur cluster biosynthetic enzyme